MIHESGSNPSSNKKELQRATEKEKILKAERGWDKEVIKKKKRIISGNVTFLWGTKGSIRCIASLVLTGKFQAEQLRLHSWKRLKL